MVTAVHEGTASANASKLEVLHDWVATVDHKKIGIMYVVMAVIFLIIAGVEAMRGVIESIANELIDSFIASGQIDMITDFANPLPATTTSASAANLGGRPTQVTGPPFRRLNFSVVRQFPAVRETFFEFRAEVFNLTNTPNFAQPGNLTFTNTNTFASISATRDNPSDPRQLQFSLKYYF